MKIHISAGYDMHLAAVYGMKRQEENATWLF